MIPNRDSLPVNRPRLNILASIKYFSAFQLLAASDEIRNIKVKYQMSVLYLLRVEILNVDDHGNPILQDHHQSKGGWSPH